MEPENPFAIAGALAGLFAFCDLEMVFNAPPRGLGWLQWFRLLAWRWGFILANAALACCLFSALREKEFLKPLPDPWLRALVVGAGYSTLIRQKLISLPNNASLGLDGLYEMIRGLINGRINHIIREWRMEQCQRLVQQKTLAVLRQDALIKVGSDAVLTQEKKATDSAYIEQIASNAATPEEDRKRMLAIYITNDKTSV